MHARIGMPISSTEGPWGRLDDFIVDPANWHVTHLVVQPRHHHDRSHLVPISEVKSSRSRLTLALSSDDIESSPLFEITEFVKIDRPQSFGNEWTTNAPSVSAWPYYPFAGPPLDPAAAAVTYGHGTAYQPGPKYLATTFDHVPDHEVQIRRSSHVISSDEHTIGTVDGFVFDGDGKITHLVLQHGHVWGRRNITIPINHARQADEDHVHLDVTRHAIDDFPSVRFHRPAR